MGEVAALHRYPVKSMAGEALPQADLRWSGIDGDRQYAFVRADDRTRFPWLSARDLSRLVLYRPAFRDPADARRSPLDVTIPDGQGMTALEHARENGQDPIVDILERAAG